MNGHEHAVMWIKPLCYPGNLSLLGTGNRDDNYKQLPRSREMGEVFI